MAICSNDELVSSLKTSSENFGELVDSLDKVNTTVGELMGDGKKGFSGLADILKDIDTNGENAYTTLKKLNSVLSDIGGNKFNPSSTKGVGGEDVGSYNIETSNRLNNSTKIQNIANDSPNIAKDSPNIAKDSRDTPSDINIKGKQAFDTLSALNVVNSSQEPKLRKDVESLFTGGDIKGSALQNISQGLSKSGTGGIPLDIVGELYKDGKGVNKDALPHLLSSLGGLNADSALSISKDPEKRQSFVDQASGINDLAEKKDYSGLSKAVLQLNDSIKTSNRLSGREAASRVRGTKLEMAASVASVGAIVSSYMFNRGETASQQASNQGKAVGDSVSAIGGIASSSASLMTIVGKMNPITGGVVAALAPLLANSIGGLANRAVSQSSISSKLGFESGYSSFVNDPSSYQEMYDNTYLFGKDNKGKFSIGALAMSKSGGDIGNSFNMSDGAKAKAIVDIYKAQSIAGSTLNLNNGLNLSENVAGLDSLKFSASFKDRPNELMENYASLSKFGDKQAQIYVGYENQGYVGHAMTNIMSKEVFGMDFTDMLKATTGDADPEKKAQLQSKLMKFTNKDNMTDATGTFQDMFSSTSPELVNAVRGMSGNTYGEDDMQEKTLDSMEGLREELAKLTKTISDATRTRNIIDRGRQIDTKQWVD
tara:strand:+ start:5187 stop:7151 length:1965 start_codon:yes stop_codon:yes gene_type:complete